MTDLQNQLIAAGYQLRADGYFGGATDTALRAFQKRQGLFPSGIANARTLNELAHPGSAHTNVMQTISRLKISHAHMVASMMGPHLEASKHPTHLSTSSEMVDLLFSAEAGNPKGIARHLYWPGGRSGVTVGAGYDMGKRTKQQVISDLVFAGVPSDKATKAADGAHKTGADAEKFCKDNKELLELDPAQQKKLFTRVLPDYESTVRGSVHVDLLQREFDALVSFAYNYPTGMTKVGSLIDQGRVEDALQHMESILVKGDKSEDDPVRLALAKRRNHEVSYYLTGNQSAFPAEP